MGERASSPGVASGAPEVQDVAEAGRVPGLRDPWDGRPPIPLAGLLERWSVSSFHRC
ncbi:MAG: hypothetical protein GVY18_14165 [Bacteroidetes bacterium]|nr:hypothetical protein [Bacteroidota bacterium]